MKTIEIFSCIWCDRGTVSPEGDKCRHCGSELHPVSLQVPVEKIVGFVVADDFARDCSIQHPLIPWGYVAK